MRRHILSTVPNGVMTTVKPYGFLAFLFDITLVLLTGGLWLIWIFVREMRNR